MALYRVECSACVFSVATNSGYEAKRLAQFHANWANDYGSPLHQVRVTAAVQAVAIHPAQALLEVAVPG